MEAAIVKFNSVAAGTLALVDYELVIEAELAFRCPGQVCTHLDVTIYVGTQDGAYRNKNSKKACCAC